MSSFGGILKTITYKDATSTKRQHQEDNSDTCPPKKRKSIAWADDTDNKITPLPVQIKDKLSGYDNIIIDDKQKARIYSVLGSWG